MKADRMYKNAKYEDAVRYYKKCLSSGNKKEIEQRLADCYIHLREHNKAANILEKFAKDSKVTLKDILNYANILKIMGKLDDAKKWYEKYDSINPHNANVKNILRAYQLLDEKKDSTNYLFFPININSPQTDFASAFYKNGILFVSGRKNNTSKIADKKTGDYYFDMYFSEKKGDKFLPAKPFYQPFNTKYHEGPASFSRNKHFIFFTRNKGRTNLDGKSELNIYSSRYGKDGWEKPELFLFSNYNFSIAHPFLSPNGKRFFFISNREGGYGGTDIYYCQKMGFRWSNPINLGPLVNTPNNEMFPYMSDDNTLYFSSDGHIGYGGLDIFKTTFEHNTWSFPANLGTPFNSAKDDFSYIISQKKSYGLFSSNRQGNDDIFMFKPNPNAICLLNGIIINKETKEGLADVTIQLISKTSKENYTKSNAKGCFSFQIFKNTGYSLMISKPGFKTKRVLYFPQAGGEGRKLTIKMEPTPWKQLTACITNKANGQGIKKAEVELINTIYNISKTSITDKYGEFTLNIDPTKRYTIIIRKPEYFTKIIRNFKYNENKFENFEIEKYNKKRTINLNNIKFKKGEYLLSEGNKKELNSIVDMLNNNPNIIINIIGNTKEDLGKKSNNLLCEKRAIQAAKYILSKDITSNRVNIKSGGYNPEKPELVVKLFYAF